MTADSPAQTLAMPRRAGAYTFAALYSMESLVRALNATVVSLQSYDILGSSQKVSELSATVSFTVLLSTLFFPYLLGRMRRRYAYSLGALFLIAASVSLSFHNLPGQALGMYLRNAGAGILHIVLSLYILDHIKRNDLARSEPLRLSLSTFAWMIGPALGVTLYTHYGPWGVQSVTIAAGLLLLLVFWYLRLSDRTSLVPGTVQPFNPLANVRRFVTQPRLRLAWLIALGRSFFWVTLFIYGPLLIVESGLGKELGGLMISASQALLLSAYVFGRLAQVHGVRIVIAAAFVVTSLASFGAGIAGTGAPYLAACLLLVGSASASALDGVGGIPFLRAVRPHERQRMTAVYRTYIDFSELIPSFVFAIALLYFPIQVVFIILGVALAVIGYVAWRHLPRSM